MKTETHMSSVSSRHWGPDDDYSVVEVQTFDIPNGTHVRVTITPLVNGEYEAYLRGETDVEGNPKPKVKSERRPTKKSARKTRR